MNICKSKCKCKTCLIKHNICWVETKFSNHIQQNQNISTVLSYSFTADIFWLWKTMCNNWRTTNLVRWREAVVMRQVKKRGKEDNLAFG